MKAISGLFSRRYEFGEEEIGAFPPNSNPVFDAALANRNTIIGSALVIEKEVSRILGTYFFGESDTEQKGEFMAYVLESSWCSFANKRFLLKHIIHDHNLLLGADKNVFDKSLIDVGSYRNAFTHGEFILSPSCMYLTYYEGGPKKVELTDGYLEAVESCLRATFLQYLSVSEIITRERAPSDFAKVGSLANPTAAPPLAERLFEQSVSRDTHERKPA